MSLLSAKEVRHLSLGFPVLDNVFSGFELGDFVVLYGWAVSFVCLMLSVRSQTERNKGGLDSSTVFIDGGNLFSPYSVAEIARSYGLDSRRILERTYVSRAFTTYQLSSLIFEKLETFLRRKRSKLLIVSDIASLFVDKDIPETESKDLFLKLCTKLSAIAAKRTLIVVASHRLGRESNRVGFLEAVLFGKSNILVRLERKGKILRFALEDHPRVKCFAADFPVADYASSHGFMEV
ncbi:hypothetical protein GTO27_08170 [Candidatus Bathyarchaeota archaeon]|nr:hypothetical protein [Candidatus Bathyarchaeota archaeon]